MSDAKYIEELPQFIDKVMTESSSELGPSDLTNLAVGVTTKGMIHVSFGKPIEWLALTTDQAEAFAAALLYFVDEIRRDPTDRGSREAPGWSMTPAEWAAIAAYVHAANALRESYPTGPELDLAAVQRRSDQFRATGEAVSPETWIRFGRHIGEQLGGNRTGP